MHPRVVEVAAADRERGADEATESEASWPCWTGALRRSRRSASSHSPIAIRASTWLETIVPCVDPVRADDADRSGRHSGRFPRPSEHRQDVGEPAVRAIPVPWDRRAARRAAGPGEGGRGPRRRGRGRQGRLRGPPPPGIRPSARRPRARERGPARRSGRDSSWRQASINPCPSAASACARSAEGGCAGTSSTARSRAARPASRLPAANR